MTQAASSASAWPRVKLGDVCEERRNHISSDTVDCDHYVTTDNMVKNIGGIVRAKDVPPGTSLVSFEVGDLLLSNIRPYLKKVWLADRNGGCSNDVIVFSSRQEKALPEYLLQVLSQESYFAHVMRDVSGTKMPRGKREWIMEFRFPLPPLAVQREIAERLDAQLARAERMRKQFLAIAENAAGRFRALLSETFAKGAAAWPRVKLGEVCQIQRGRVMSQKYLKAHPGQYPVFSSQTKNEGVFGYIDTFDFDGEYLTWTTDGANAGSVFYHNGKFSITNVCGLLKANPALWDAKCLCLFLELVAKSHVNKSMGNPKLMSNVVAGISVPLPPLAEQRAIVERLDAARAACSRAEELARKGAGECAGLRAALLQETFA